VSGIIKHNTALSAWARSSQAAAHAAHFPISSGVVTVPVIID